jgi:hypothetical protein
MNKTDYEKRIKAVRRESRECHAPIRWLPVPVPLSPLRDIQVVGVSSDHPELVAEYERRAAEYARRAAA